MTEVDLALNTSAHESHADTASIADPIRDRIRRARQPVIITHARADADAAGSAIAMRYLCQHLGATPIAVVTGDGNLPPSLQFLDREGSLVRNPNGAAGSPDLLVFVDCADPDRANPLFEQIESQISGAWESINVDHHVTNTRFGDINLVVPEAAATAEILERLFDALGVPIEADCATTLLAGIYGDTLGLRTPSTRPATMRAAAALVEAGADLDLIVDHIFRTKPFSTIKLWAEALQAVQWHGRLIWSSIDNDMLERSDAKSTEAEGFVNFIAGTIGAFAAALFQEDKDGWRVSLRSTRDDVDVAALAQRFGGGGHARAAGLKLPAGEEHTQRFLDEVSSFLAALPEHPSLPRVDDGGE